MKCILPVFPALLDRIPGGDKGRAVHHCPHLISDIDHHPLDAGIVTGFHLNIDIFTDDIARRRLHNSDRRFRIRRHDPAQRDMDVALRHAPGRIEQAHDEILRSSRHLDRLPISLYGELAVGNGIIKPPLHQHALTDVGLEAHHIHVTLE